MNYDLYDEKGSCRICSGSYVQHRVEPGELYNHARKHKEAGDPVKISYAAGIRKAGDAPTIFKVEASQKQREQDRRRRWSTATE